MHRITHSQCISYRITSETLDMCAKSYTGDCLPLFTAHTKVLPTFVMLIY